MAVLWGLPPISVSPPPPPPSVAPSPKIGDGPLCFCSCSLTAQRMSVRMLLRSRAATELPCRDGGYNCIRHLIETRDAAVQGFENRHAWFQIPFHL